MRLVVLYKYMICTADKATGTWVLGKTQKLLSITKNDKVIDHKIKKNFEQTGQPD